MKRTAESNNNERNSRAFCQQPTTTELPPELWCAVLSTCDLNTILRATAVCKDWFALMSCKLLSREITQEIGTQLEARKFKNAYNLLNIIIERELLSTELIQNLKQKILDKTLEKTLPQDQPPIIDHIMALPRFNLNDAERQALRRHVLNRL